MFVPLAPLPVNPGYHTLLFRNPPGSFCNSQAAQLGFPWENPNILRSFGFHIHLLSFCVQRLATGGCILIHTINDDVRMEPTDGLDSSDWSRLVMP